MGIATCSRFKQEGARFGFNLSGVNTSGDFDQTELVRKLIAS